MRSKFYFTFIIALLVTTSLALPIFVKITGPQAAAASGFISYEAENFSKIRAEGKSMVVHVHASWCPACKQQVPVLQALAQDPEFDGVQFVRVDFDTEKAFLRENRVPVQSIVLVYKNGGEPARIVGVVDAKELTSRIRAAVS